MSSARAATWSSAGPAPAAVTGFGLDPGDRLAADLTIRAADGTDTSRVTLLGE